MLLATAYAADSAQAAHFKGGQGRGAACKERVAKSTHWIPLFLQCICLFIGQGDS
jgi:hypothetical protein